MAETDSHDNRTPLFVGSAEQLQALETWIDEFTRAVGSRCVESGGQESYVADLVALNKALSKGGDYLGCLNPVDAEECLRLIRELQKEVTTLLASGLAGLVNLSGEQERAYEQCQSILKFAVPHFQGLGVRIRGETRSIGQTDPIGHTGSKAEPSVPPTGGGEEAVADDKAESTAKNTKRRTAPGEARAIIIAGLSEHHKFDGNSCLNPEPINVHKFVDKYGSSVGSVSRFLKEQFEGWDKYKGHFCRDAATLTTAIKMIRGELPPSMIYNRVKDETALEDREE